MILKNNKLIKMSDESFQLESHEFIGFTVFSFKINMYLNQLNFLKSDFHLWTKAQVLTLIFKQSKFYLRN